MSTWLKAFGITLLQVTLLCVMLGLLAGSVYLAYLSILSTDGWAILVVVVVVILVSMTRDNKKMLEDERERATKAE